MNYLRTFYNRFYFPVWLFGNLCDNRTACSPSARLLSCNCHRQDKFSLPVIYTLGFYQQFMMGKNNTAMWDYPIPAYQPTLWFKSLKPIN